MKLTTALETWELKRTFRTSRRSFDHVETMMVTLEKDGARGRGEAVGVNYRGETAKSVQGQIEQLRDKIETGLSREELQDLLPPGGARNALDCALWDIECKDKSQTIWALTGIKPSPVTTAYTVVIDEPHRMYEAAGAAPEMLLKIKVSADGAFDQITAVREARPDARLIVDGNQDFTLDQLKALIARIEKLGIEMIEQPLAAGADDGLSDYASPIPLCADESFHTEADIAKVSGRYRYASIKLEKAGGLTNALSLIGKVEDAGLGVMIGCWAATSLSMAPAFVVAQGAAYADIDGPLLLKQDRPDAMEYRKGIVNPPHRRLWG
ncbi:dipeptide epimerase [Parvularcula flava]|uniref:Dipeptide epimerase n=1 Tax=Aquisalinus luteolus TaxID=1566827 RepID=A0A8J3ES48_9PROT|nr:dipeptide epimerase [Aquisalinus luteolus]NHK29232.1 dipeptide epimerase [Aquisalinus luteolus]GGH99889.1 dipeptide epimerase [Aquisalinus luteolus]